jgi:RNA polymerase sigma-70 factor (ECF subfamily)
VGQKVIKVEFTEEAALGGQPSKAELTQEDLRRLDALRDKRLLSAIADGDDEALKLFYSVYSNLVYSIAYRILSNRHDAEDCLQQAFVRVWKSAADYNPLQAEPITWLSFIARNAAIDLLRKRSRGPVLLSDLDTPPSEPIHTAASEASLERDNITFCMAALSSEQREALSLAYNQGCTQSEIAAAMRIPLGNVKNHLRRGLLKFRQLYSRHE